jgi:hypothetical protein
MKNRVIISVLSSEESPYDILEESIRKTWVNLNKNSVPIFFYYGINTDIEVKGDKIDGNWINGDKIYIDVTESYWNIGFKTIGMLELLYEKFDFDYIYRTNSSSYVDINMLYDFLDDKPNENFYCGLKANCSGNDFCSGSGYFLSRDLVKFIIDNKEFWDHSLVDDVSVGKLLARKEVSPINGSRFDFPSSNPPIDFFHYRCKESSGDRQVDVNNMKLLYELKKNI